MYLKSMITAMFMMSLVQDACEVHDVCDAISIDFHGACKVHDICDVHDVSEIHDICDVHDILKFRIHSQLMTLSVLYCKDIFVRDSDLRFSKSGIFISRPNQSPLINSLNYFLFSFRFRGEM
jgi:hypothetical protein